MKNGIWLLCGADLPAELIFKPIAQLAARGAAVFVVDGDNSFRSYAVSRAARALRIDPARTLDAVKLSRAFTCYQFAELVTTKLSHLDHADRAAIVCLGLLGTFYDEDVPLPEAQRLLQSVIASIKTLSQNSPILITLRPPPAKARNRAALIRVLVECADSVRVLEPGAAGALPAGKGEAYVQSTF
jgi:hypothetical protein